MGLLHLTGRILKHTVFGAFRSFWSPIRSHCELSADFFNRL